MGQDPLIGTDVRQAFDEVLNARKALVVSPWIQEPYASALLKMVMEGRAKVVTSTDRENAFYNLIKGGTTAVISGWRAIAVVAWVFSAFIIAASYLASLINPFGLIIAIPATIALIITGKRILQWFKQPKKEEKKWVENIRLSPPLGQDGFIHIKLYIADDRAWVGSANMTVSAWKHNIETLVPIDLETAMRIFEKAWQHASPPGG